MPEYQQASCTRLISRHLKISHLRFPVAADPKSGHAIQDDNPAIVAEAIQQVINAIASKSKL